MAAAQELIGAPAPESAPPPGPPELPAPDGRDWYDRLERWVEIAVLAACCVFVLIQLHPGLLLENTTITGGDTGAHVWFPAFLRDHLLPWRVAGWSNDFYAGFPAGQFYFPFPALLIVALDLVLPYNVAFKLVTALGPVAFPAGAYVFARGIRAPRPAAAMFAGAATGFLFFTGGGDSTMLFDLHIMGGNLASTFAGEYSFMIALAAMFFFFGTLVRALDRRGPLWLPAVLLAVVVTSHLVVGVFAVIGAVVLWLVFHPLRNFTRVAAVGVVGVLLTAVWLVPLVATLGYTTNMRYEPVGASPDQYLDWMFLSEHWYLYPLAIVALGAGIYYRRRATVAVTALAAAAALAFYNWEGIRAVFGSAPAWNLRMLPFWYVMLYLLAALGVTELARFTAIGVTWVIRGTERQDWRDDEIDPDAAVARLRSRRATRVVAIAVLAVVAATVALVRVEQTRSFLPYWARYNYTGYEGGSASNFTKKSWDEYRAFIDTADKLAPGRMAWEGGDAIGAYGTPLALMLLPYWTHGRIASMEGLYFEASATTPYHFMMIATLAQTPSNPVRGLPYRTIADFDLGVRYLQLMGVRYYAAFTPQAKAAAAKNPALSVVATVPDLDKKPPNGWTIYQVADSPTVQGLAYQPVVVDDPTSEASWRCEGAPEPTPGATPADFSAWECSAVPWFNDPQALDRPLTTAGPASWVRAPAATAREVARKPLPKVHVSNIRTTESSISFDVDRTGVPVMVKTSYFPNWEAHGADGPYRATPNFMVVVPTSKHVELTYGTTRAEWAGRVLTVAGIVGLAGLVWWGITAARRPAPLVEDAGTDGEAGRPDPADPTDRVEPVDPDEGDERDDADRISAPGREGPG